MVWIQLPSEREHESVCYLNVVQDKLYPLLFGMDHKEVVLYTVLSKPLNNVMTPEGISSKTTANSLGETGKLNFCKKS